MKLGYTLGFCLRILRQKVAKASTPRYGVRVNLKKSTILT